MSAVVVRLGPGGNTILDNQLDWSCFKDVSLSTIQVKVYLVI